MGVLKKIAQKLGAAPPDVDGEAMLALLQSGKQLDNVAEQASQIEIPEQKDPDAPLSEEQKAPVFETGEAQANEDERLRLFCARMWWLIKKDRFKIIQVPEAARVAISAIARGAAVASHERQWLLEEMNNWSSMTEGWNQIRDMSAEQLVADVEPIAYGYMTGSAQVAQGNNNIMIGFGAQEAASQQPEMPPSEQVQEAVDSALEGLQAGDEDEDEDDDE